MSSNDPTCPHCLKAFHDERIKRIVGRDADGTWIVEHRKCPACSKVILELAQLPKGHLLNQSDPDYQYWQATSRIMIRPKSISRHPFQKEIPDKYLKDYVEACLVLNDSPKSSAALSRRCLQHLLCEEAATTKRDLVDQINEVLNLGTLPSYISQNIDVIRQFGNFAAHANRLKTTGEIVDVEPGEAEWCLEILEDLLDFYIVRPAIAKEKRDALNKTLAGMQKPELKQPPP
jgi:uncharacterized protein DUF4145